MSSESSLIKILRDASPARRIIEQGGRDLGVADGEPFPFLALIGQKEMKLALLLSIINPEIGGVVLIGSRGTAKTTAVRSLVDLLPIVTRSLCPNNLNCNEEAIEKNGLTAVCKECAQKFGYQEPLTRKEKMRLVELPLNARLDDVVGGINERTLTEKGRIKLEKGVLAQANNHLLYIDEVNLLEDAVLDAILDASAQGYYTVRRGANNLTYRARFVLTASMNPEEGRLRPQIMDRFGLRVIVRGLDNSEDRFVAYEQALRHRQNAEELSAEYADATLELALEIQKAADLLPEVTISPEAKK
ncbi:MAG: ATP-binding protein, partial [Chloroflexota bacterium]